jgi:L-asparaginase II
VTSSAHRVEDAGMDGCSIPTYPIPLTALARGFARFGTGIRLRGGLAAASRRVRAAVAAHPFMVAGTGRFDTRLMETLGERAFVKVGAEGVYCAALPEQGLGIALKIDDGATRAAEVAMAAVVRRFLVLADAERKVVDELAAPVLRNWNGLAVGSLRAAGAIA